MSKCKVTVLPVSVWSNIQSRAGLSVVTTVSNASSRWESGLSPFIIGPCKLYDGKSSKNMENAWQYAKVYKEHDNRRIPSDSYWSWADKGWDNPRAVRYPMGRGRRPEYSWWEDEDLDYISARKRIYGPLYAEAVRKEPSWKKLECVFNESKELVLLDYDAYDHRALGYSLSDVLNNPNRKMGHAFILAMMLTRNKALKEMELRE